MCEMEKQHDRETRGMMILVVMVISTMTVCVFGLIGFTVYCVHKAARDLEKEGLKNRLVWIWNGTNVATNVTIIEYKR